MGKWGWVGALGVFIAIAANALQFLDFFECKPWNEKSVCYWGSDTSTADASGLSSVTPPKQKAASVTVDLPQLFVDRQRPITPTGNQLRIMAKRNILLDAGPAIDDGYREQASTYPELKQNPADTPHGFKQWKKRLEDARSSY